ncbi:hypothetical protein [Catenuloplanes japonicus]|uniref:hypothetical protein n=1 Tax=Catenuloplanes japonicus TaxID=33876 RepID=UPI0012F7E9B2|nr:hypothetical protein [Catenuloplanes japonicus]
MSWMVQGGRVPRPRSSTVNGLPVLIGALSHDAAMAVVEAHLMETGRRPGGPSH